MDACTCSGVLISRHCPSQSCHCHCYCTGSDLVAAKLLGGLDLRCVTGTVYSGGTLVCVAPQECQLCESLQYIQPHWTASYLQMNIMEAKSNSYRYYESLPQPDAEKAERAFDSVLIAWAESWVGISALALTLSMVDWASLSLLWRATGDLTAPISACFLMHCVDFRFIQQTLRSQQRQRT